jgi:hypothetical protein
MLPLAFSLGLVATLKPNILYTLYICTGDIPEPRRLAYACLLIKSQNNTYGWELSSLTFLLFILR